LVGVQSINEEGVDVDDLGIMHWGENIKESSNGCQLKESVVNMVAAHVRSIWAKLLCIHDFSMLASGHE
jgi:hypothetical protein